MLLNGLGRTKYEEMFVVYRQVNRRLRAPDCVRTAPKSGSSSPPSTWPGSRCPCCSLDDELAELYDAPCDTPAFRSLPGTHTAEDDTPGRRCPGPYGRRRPVPYGDGCAPGEDLPATAALQAALDLVAADEDELGRLDAVAGDGDHGIGIVRGLRAAVAAARAAEPGRPRDPHSAGTALLTAGLALADASGGASGALYGALLAETGAVLTKAGPAATSGQETAAQAPGSGGAAGRCAVTLFADAADAAQRAVSDLGGAEVGEKTMLDALDPFRRELRARAGDGLAKAWQAAAEAATRAAADTAHLTPARGRAARMGALGHGHPDAGPSPSRCSSPRSANTLTLNRPSGGPGHAEGPRT